MMKQEQNSNNTKNIICEEVQTMKGDNHYLYNLLFAGKITLKEYLQGIKSEKQQHMTA